MEKTIKEIFKDYNSNSFSLNASKIKSINLFKKTNRLELIITADEFIKIEDIYNFEQYLKNRFNIFEANIKIEYSKEIEVDIEQEWNYVICYMAHKHPLSKAFLKCLCPPPDSIVVNLHNWNGSGCISGEAYTFAKSINVELQDMDAFYIYVNKL